jgi:glycosyltransferase involved in cell wall biosynthesis
MRGRLLWVNHFAVTMQEAGGTRHAGLARELVRLGWDVTIAASDFNLLTRQYSRRRSAGDRAPIVEMQDGVRFVWLWAAPYSSNDWRRGRNWLTFARSLKRWARQQSVFDIVIGSSPHLFAASAARDVARRSRARFVFEVRDLWPEGLVAGGGRKGPFYYLLDFIARRLYAHADRIIVLARGAAAYLEKRGIRRAKLVYVPNGVDAAMLDTPELHQTVSRPFTIVYAGAHGPVNGLDTVVAAADALRNDSGIRFVLVGDGPAKAGLQESAAARQLTNIEFRSPVPKSEMPAVFAAADAGLMVLRDADLFSFAVSPNKLFDYLGAALPVVSNVPGEVAGMLAESKAGVQAANTSPGALVDAVRALRDRGAPELRRMGAAGREWVQREHSRTRLADRLDAALRELSVA